ncbi:Kinesin- protein 12 [Desmophyllum pertusum]|uniref:Kinesin-like protein n=1 Tax=Desmophyllum pertusum TaxID=174260 RepID=A0A9W9ZSY8_9CNID|nr:Kinesin- protein 12 [Desmophyllum pertusum]
MPKSHDMEQSSSSNSRKNRGELCTNSAGERSPLYDSDSPSDTPSVNGSAPASESTSARSSRSSTLGSGLSSRSTESDGEIEALDNVRVVARARPLNLFEKERGDKNIIKLPGDGAVWIDNSFGQIKPFTFNAAFGEDTSQQQMFEGCGIKHLVEMAVEGYSCTAFAYGQTGSGKTYTITGPLNLESPVDKEKFIPDPEMQGLIERSFHYLFELMDNHSDVEYTLKASYLEVYNEKVQDLLNPSKARDSLPVRWARDRGFYVENLFFVECDRLDDLTAVLEEGLRNRQVGSHLMNDHSSRSHSMLTVYIDIESNDPEDESGYPVVKHGKLSLVDLAGSERVKETKSVGGTFAESQNINKSLLTLGNCISALSDPRKKSGHIPYRDSKLTKLLADSLGGDGITLMIACISPSSYVVQDTLNTLRYAHRAKRIKNKPVVHMDPKEKLILSLKREIKLLRTENAYFRQQLGLPSSESQTSLASNGSKTTTGTENGSTPKLNPPSPQPVRKLLQVHEDSQQRLTTASMAAGANSGLYDMLQEYMVENEHLRTTNVELVHSREEVSRQQMVLSRENDRLSKKLEELERVIVSSPMSSLRTLSGVESLRGVERTSSLPEERFMNSTFPVYSAGARPSPFASEPSRLLERRNSVPMQSKDRRRSSTSDPVPPAVVTKFPPIQNGPYPNYVGQGGWHQRPEAQAAYHEVAPEPNNGYHKALQAHSVPDHSQKQKPTVSTKKRAVPVSDRPQKAANSYARMFAAQKEKKAKEAKENDGKNSNNNDVNHRSGTMEHFNPPVHMDGMSHGGHPNPGWPVDKGIPSTYDPALVGNHQLAERTRQELEQLDSQIEYNRFMAQNRYNKNPPR